MRLYRLLRPLLFRLDPETAHNLVLNLLAMAGPLPPLRALLRRLFGLPDPGLEVQALGLDFPNPVGLAAGYDKDGRAIQGLACLGFGHLELGTVTRLAQAGNPKPRITRLVEDQAVINRMGFPNDGALALLRRLRRERLLGTRVGVNIGKGADTPIERAVEDYLALVKIFYLDTDYLAVNVSSPNTPGLRSLQERKALGELLRALKTERDQLRSSEGRYVPIAIKLAPDLDQATLEHAIDEIMTAGLDGVIATNTTVAREGLRSPRQSEEGGLSGAPLRERSTEIIRRIHRMSGGRLAIIGAGGIMGPDDAREKLDAGAVLVQLYTGLVFRGPGMVRQIIKDLRAGVE
ncbi:MAG: quinone-dependent dihydroorotate dehydrogenase [Anaerolineales bacterium]|jgi:dihydroorotate dehydrogenase